MKLKYLFTLAALAVPAIVLAQGEAAVQQYSRQDLGGSARFQSMAGAFGSLGGDFSSVQQNPAGIALMRARSELSLTFSGGSVKDNASWLGNSNRMSKGLFKIDGISYTSSMNRGKKVGYSFGFGMNRNGSFERNISVGGLAPDRSYSVADFIAGITTLAEDNIGKIAPDNLGKSNAWNKGIPWFPILGYQSGMINPTNKNGGPYHTRFTYKDGNRLVPFGPRSAELTQYRESGDILNIDFSFGLNVQETFYFGASLTYKSIFYKLRSGYNESFMKPDYLFIQNALETDGSGLGGSLGMIVQPVQGLKFGVAYFTPTWYYMRDRYIGYAESRTPNLTPDGSYEIVDKDGKPVFFLKTESPEGTTDYRMKTPGRFVASASYIFQKIGLLSFDYEYRKVGQNRLSDTEYNYNVYKDINDAVRDDFGEEHTWRVGLEVKPSVRSALRAGYMYRTNPLNKKLTENFEAPAPVEIITGTTLPHYTLFEGQQAFTFGGGYRITPKLYMDVAMIFASQKSHTYTFPSINTPKVKVESLPAINVDSKKFSAALTIGYKF
ncbi:Outer membrane protein transport protein (OMPP1/FadL/TodX) [Porphyromonas macacae]|uniref:Outer membrane protein transport protein (OMPP1/FadL/TodX) n=1 Tax=Porphyromonas macacae TaxID=28115 RepID=A0A379E731_9PORP|nr:hypothetical protein [Porphyromonas macacae]SUB88141.1 Outer membrane protein transport protein (OMPP1/FadL/TodX) [Porphyromonas macacae]